LWLNYTDNLKYLCKIIIPNDATLCIEKDKIKTDKLNLNLIEKFDEWISNDVIPKIKRRLLL
jgi:hypothetical protein